MLALSDDELEVVMNLAAPLPPQNCNSFLEAIAAELRGHAGSIGTRVLLFWVGVQLAVGFTVPFVAILLALVISTTGALAFQLETPRSDQVTLICVRLLTPCTRLLA